MDTKTKILIAYDGSRCADAAINDLWRAGLPNTAEAVVVSVAESWLPPPSSAEIIEATLPDPPSTPNQEAPQAQTWSDFVAGSAQSKAEFGCGHLKDYFPEWEIRPEVRTGSPASEILSLADEWKPDLIVVGSHGRSAFGRFILGSVSHRIVAEAQGSVRVARGHFNNPKAAVRIILGLDGSRKAESALQAIKSRNWPKGSQVQVIAVQDPIQPIPVNPLFPTNVEGVPYSREEERAWVRTIVDVAADELRGVGLEAKGLVRLGDPRQVLAEVCEDWKADCIFVGARGLTKLDRFLLGSVSTAVAMRAHSSVEIIR